VVKEYERGYADGYAQAQVDEKNRPGLHVIHGVRICDGCGKGCEWNQDAFYIPAPWYKPWEIGKTFHAECLP
jgi:hypothetical protein